MAHPNEETLRRADEALGQGNPAAMFDMFADDAVIHVGGRSKLAGDYKGKDQMMGAFGSFMASLGESPEMVTHDILANDTHGIQLQTIRANRGGQRVEINAIGIFHFDGGKATEAWFIDEDPYSADPFYDGAS